MMSDVVIVGGGLTGLSAAWELERLGVSMTLIEVKPRLGGSIITHREGGFILDGAAFILEKYDDWEFLAELGLAEALVKIGTYRDGDLVIFRDGTETIIEALAARIHATLMMRMAVSSIGLTAANPAMRIALSSSGLTAADPARRCGICLENGLLLEARAVIVTAPARYIGHMLWATAPDAVADLDGYEYDPVVRVSLGYRRADLKANALPDPPPHFKFLEAYHLPERVPADHVLVRAGVRLNSAIPTPADALAATQALIPAQPVVAWARYWAEADPLTRALPEHLTAMAALDAAVAPSIVIAGSDYRAQRFDQQVRQGRAAARKIAATL